jgi:hypothetical protein
MVVDVLGSIAQVHPALLFVVFLAFVFVAYKVFRVLLKAVIVGVIAALFPFFASYIGVPMATDLSTMLWFGTFGVLFVILYSIFHSLLSAGSSIFGRSDEARARDEARREARKELEKREKEKGKG